jgi:hypothetical protein
MNIPKSEYSLDQFLGYLVEHEQEVFGSEDRKQWLKIYLVHAKKDWKPLFEKFVTTQFGQLYRISMSARGLSHPVEFYVHEWRKGFLMFFTSSRREEYEKTLSKFIRRNRGISEMWISSDVFAKIRNHMLETFDARIYKFISRRTPLSETPADFRPDFDRRFSYTGEDATIVLKEALKYYGVVPDSISFRVGEQKLQVTSNGMLLFLSVNDLSIKILQGILALLVDPQSEIRDVADSLGQYTEILRLGHAKITAPFVRPGIIKLENVKLNRYVIERFFKQEEPVGSHTYVFGPAEGKPEFSFINTSVREGSFSFSATVVDDIKGTMFGISGSTDQMTLVPMHRTTFESFIRFYKLVIEGLDKEANFNVFAPPASFR